MFDTKKFGAYVARQRKNADLTQSELAEKLNLTRQAVSKYELGDSFPDISILVQIAKIFKITLDELIGSGNPTKGETEIIKNVIDTEESTISINDIINLAPLIKPSILGVFSKKLRGEGINISHVVSMMQYLNDEDVVQVFTSAGCNLMDNELLEKIIPFLDIASKEVILKKIIEGECDWHLIKALLPHMGSIAPLLEAAVMEGALPKEVLETVSDYFLR